jgi:hypothetical protein
MKGKTLQMMKGTGCTTYINYPKLPEMVGNDHQVTV